MRRIIYHSKSHNPFFNLAFEQFLSQDAKEFGCSDQVLLLYRNSPSIIIGRNQNVWLECHVAAAQHANIPILRRWSGGGCVYHDLGNVNYSWQQSKTDFSRSYAADSIIRALKRSDLFLSPRHDIFLKWNENGFKVSGSAYKIGRERAYHHGTFLIKSELSILGNLLNSNIVSDPSKENAFGVTSVRSAVSNVPNLEIDEFVHNVQQFFNPHEINTIDESCTIPLIHEYMSTLQSWEWTFAKSPPAWLLIPEINTNFHVIDGTINDTDNEKYKNLIGKPFYVNSIMDGCTENAFIANDYIQVV